MLDTSVRHGAPATRHAPVALVRLRPARPPVDGAPNTGDTRAVRDFLCRLSPATTFARFFTGLGRPSDTLVRLLVRRQPTGWSWVAESQLAAAAGAAGEAGPRVVGHASWTVDASGVAEISVVVDDAWHGMGVGHGLVDRVIADATASGAATLRLDVLASNRRVIGMISRRWPDARAQRDGTELTYHVPLARSARP